MRRQFQPNESFPMQKTTSREHTTSATCTLVECELKVFRCDVDFSPENRLSQTADFELTSIEFVACMFSITAVFMGQSEKVGVRAENVHRMRGQRTMVLRW